MDTNTNPILVNPREAARLLSISLPTLYRLTRAGKLPFTKIGRSTRFRFEDLTRFASAIEQPAPERS